MKPSASLHFQIGGDNLSNGYSLVVKPFLDDRHRGVFSTRAPKRPNSIGISIVKLVGISGNILHIEDVDIVDGTPLLDIKPFVPEFDMRRADKIGWFADKSRDVKDTRADERFK
ncbi:MAG: SAM-dependent methyltransferase [Deltaproteobacteria bacterium]|nr:SAM-dependent methyltransferase [Deltaproteobacteria bacterium]